MNDNNNDELLKQVQKLFKQAMGNNVEVGINTDKDSVFDWDSINHLNLIVEMENEFELGLSMEEIENLLSVKQIIRLINDKRKK
jgi:acyl carrier protein